MIPLWSSVDLALMSKSEENVYIKSSFELYPFGNLSFANYQYDPNSKCVRNKNAKPTVPTNNATQRFSFLVQHRKFRTYIPLPWRTLKNKNPYLMRGPRMRNYGNKDSRTKRFFISTSARYSIVLNAKSENARQFSDTRD